METIRILLVVILGLVAATSPQQPYVVTMTITCILVSAYICLSIIRQVSRKRLSLTRHISLEFDRAFLRYVALRHNIHIEAEAVEAFRKLILAADKVKPFLEKDDIMACFHLTIKELS